MDGILESLTVTFRHIFKRSITVPYPNEKKELPKQARWRHILLRHENGLERCVGCSLCAGACPSKCIHVEAAENSENERYSPGERYAKVFDINMLRCIFCGYCEDACPVNAIVLRDNFELSDYDRDRFIYTKERLLLY
ncbi:MAG: NADH-quinone oxidoreductase subunit NuoI [Nitrospirota bacterium]